MKKQLHALEIGQVKIQDAFWSHVQNLIIEKVLPYQADIMEDKIPGVEKSHAVENFRIAAGQAEGAFYGMVFQDSDIAKWLEAVAYSLAVSPNPELEKKADEMIELVRLAQEEDGYLNTFFSLKEPEHKWQNLQECHELYCSGHMIEAAVAYHQATGKDTLLQVMCKNADLICSRFGKGKTQGIPGHQEIELALLRLYRVTGKQAYMDTAKYFLEERGKDPNFFAQEHDKRGWQHFGMDPHDRKYAQNHAPVKEQDKAVGHSVRAVYMYTAMADLAAQSGDQEMYDACRRLWDNIVQRQMYITGGIGSTAHGEAFTVDYDLPNDTIYAETCASVAMVFFARRMLEMEPRGEYADIMEKELYNGVLSGMQLDGTRFFYVNPLEVVPGISGELAGYRHVLPQRPNWYACACCPPNVSRLMTSLGRYAWGESDNTVYAHLFMGGEAAFTKAANVKISCSSEYPRTGKVQYRISAQAAAQFRFAVRIPGWCKAWKIMLNGEETEAVCKDGYAYISRSWENGDTVELSFAILPRRVYTSTKVRENAGCVALMRGPFVYCLEEQENGSDLSALRLPREADLSVEETQDAAIGSIQKITAAGKRLNLEDSLYSEAPPAEQEACLQAIPYYMWGNRSLGEMRVWIHES